MGGPSRSPSEAYRKRQPSVEVDDTRNNSVKLLCEQLQRSRSSKHALWACSCLHKAVTGCRRDIRLHAVRPGPLPGCFRTSSNAKTLPLIVPAFMRALSLASLLSRCASERATSRLAAPGAEPAAPDAMSSHTHHASRQATFRADVCVLAALLLGGKTSESLAVFPSSFQLLELLCSLLFLGRRRLAESSDGVGSLLQRMRR